MIASKARFPSNAIKQDRLSDTSPRYLTKIADHFFGGITFFCPINIYDYHIVKCTKTLFFREFPNGRCDRE